MCRSAPQGASSSSLKAIIIVVILLTLFSPLHAEEGHESGRALDYWSVMAFPRYWISIIFGLAGLLLLARARFTRNLRLALLPVIFFVFAVVAALPLGMFARRMGLHPSPVCTVTKPFLFVEGGKAVPVVFWVSLTVVALLTILGNKLFCGWVCPIGALQELIHRIPVPKRFRGRVPFKAANSIRLLIFILFIVVVFTAGVEIYEYFNPFEALHWEFGIVGMIAIGAVAVAALFLWRPFCYLVCPLGLVTWVLEQFSIFRIRVDKDICRDCDRCIEESPCLAMFSIVKGSRVRPDCFACGLCLDRCNKGGLGYRSRL
jgi:polyferredoxin